MPNETPAPRQVNQAIPESAPVADSDATQRVFVGTAGAAVRPQRPASKPTAGTRTAPARSADAKNRRKPGMSKKDKI